ncbi:hypothetical protein T06_4213 [Trichinella sp. T6]|nr:hypothetical protein T06_4213 [Trichinella sp. T6]
MVLIGRIEQCISPVHTVLRHSCKVKTKVKKSENADDTKQITDRTKQNKRRQKVNTISSVCLFSEALLRT